MPPAPITTRLYTSPCGALLLGCYGTQLCLCDWVEGTRHVNSLARLQRRLGTHLQEGNTPTLQQASDELDAYFSGTRHAFTAKLLLLGTPFQQSIWQQLRHIPFGETHSYAALAQQTGHTGAARAVAQAVGNNPLCLFLPCHRIVGSGGTLCGYRGGTHTKRWLLEWEHGAISADFPQQARLFTCNSPQFTF